MAAPPVTPPDGTPGGAGHSRFGRSGNGYRFDHAFLTDAHRGQLVSCGHDHAPRAQGLTDHSVLALELALDEGGHRP